MEQKNFLNRHKKTPTKGVKAIKSFHLHINGLVQRYKNIFNSKKVNQLN